MELVDVLGHWPKSYLKKRKAKAMTVISQCPACKGKGSTQTEPCTLCEGLGVVVTGPLTPILETEILNALDDASSDSGG